MISEIEKYAKKITAITNRYLCDGDFLSQIELLCQIGISSIILREKDMTEKEYEKLAERVIDIGKRYNTQIILHSFVNAAKKLGSTAIHLPMPAFLEMKGSRVDEAVSAEKEEQLKSDIYYDFKIIGVSTHTVEEAITAQNAGASYITASHIYATECKKNLKPKGIEYLKSVCHSVNIPVYALGGINFNNIEEALEAGAEKVCMMSEMMKVRL